MGDPKVASALSHFYHAWDKPFRDSMKRLDEMGELLDSVATQFFTMDAKFAAKAQSSLSAMMYAQWQSERDEYQLYQETKDEKFQPSPLWGADGRKHDQEAVPLLPWENPPEDPGAAPTQLNAEDVWNELHPGVPYPGDSTPTVTSNQYDDHERLVSQETTVQSDKGLGYTEKTTYTYDDDGKDPSQVRTELTHSDGTTETIVTHYNDDGTITSENSFVDPDNSKNNSSSTTNTTFKPDGGGYTSVSKNQDGEETVIEVVNNPGTTTDTRVMTDDEGRVRKWVVTPTPTTGSRPRAPASTTTPIPTASPTRPERQRQS